MKIAVMNQKGGSGKTTLSGLLVKSLPGCLAVDLDPQAGLTALLSGEPEGAGVFDMIMGDDVKPIDKGSFHLLQADHRLDGIYATVQPFVIQSILKPLKFKDIVMDCPPTTQGITRAAALYADKIIIPADVSRPTMRATLYTLKSLKEIKKAGRVYLIGKDYKEKRGYIADLTRDFLTALGESFGGYIPKSVSIVKASNGIVKDYDFIRGIING